MDMFAYWRVRWVQIENTNGWTLHEKSGNVEIAEETFAPDGTPTAQMPPLDPFVAQDTSEEVCAEFWLLDK